MKTKPDVRAPKPRTVLVLVADDSAWQSLPSELLAQLYREVAHLLVASFTNLTKRKDYAAPLIKLNGVLYAEWPLDAIILVGDAPWSGVEKFTQQFGTLVTRADTRTKDATEFLTALSDVNITPLHDDGIEVDDSPREQQARPSGARSVVMFWKQNDTGMYGRRSEMLARYLAGRDDVSQVLVVDALIEESKLIEYLSGAEGSFAARVYTHTVARALCSSPLDEDGKLGSTVFVAGRYYKSAKTYLGFLQRQFAALGIEPAAAIFLLYPKLSLGRAFVRIFQPYRVVTDIVDDHRTWPGVSADERMQLTLHYRDLITRSDYVLTNCLPQKVAMSAFGKPVQLLPNGCDPVPPNSANPANQVWLERIAKHRQAGGGVLGYVGNIESKVDIELLEKLARARPDVVILLIGSNHNSAPALLQLQAYSNVWSTGILEYVDAGALISLIDIGLVPHYANELTKAMNPLKVLTYLAYHKPVVATSVPNLANCSYVFIEPGHAQFIARVSTLLTEIDTLDSDVFKQFCEAHSWQALFEPFFDNVLESR